MNKTAKYLLGLSLVCTLSQAQNIAVTSDWKLVGATEDITITNFDNTCVNTVWWYDSADSSDWKLYMNTSSYPSTPSNTELKTTGTISKGSGFWIKGDSSCTVDTNTATQAPVSSTYTLLESDVSGKTFTIDGNDGEGWVIFTLNSNNTGTEIGYYQNGSQEFSENITWSINSGKLKIILNSDSSVAHITFDAKPANSVTGKYVGDETLDIDVSDFGDVVQTKDYTETLPANSLYSSWPYLENINSYSDMKNNFLTTPIANYFTYNGTIYMFASSGSLCYAETYDTTYDTKTRTNCSDTIGTWIESNSTMIATLANGEKIYHKFFDGYVQQYKND